MGYMAYPIIPFQMVYQMIPVQMVESAYPMFPTTENAGPIQPHLVPLKTEISEKKAEKDNSWWDQRDIINKDDNILQPDKPLKRWKRDNDKQLFQLLSAHWASSGDTLNNISLRLKQNPIQERKLWRGIANLIKWKGPTKKIQK